MVLCERIIQHYSILTSLFYDYPTEAMSASQMSKRSLPEMSYMDLSNKSILFELAAEDVVSIISETDNFESSKCYILQVIFRMAYLDDEIHTNDAWTYICTLYLHPVHNLLFQCLYNSKYDRCQCQCCCEIFNHELSLIIHIIDSS